MSDHITTAGTIWQAEVSTFLFSSTSSQVTSVLSVILLMSGTNILRQRKSLSIAKRMAVMVSKIWRSMGTKSPVTPAHVIISSTNLRISSIKLLTINYKLTTNAHGWQSKVHTLSAKCLALLPCMIPLLMMAKQSS